MKVDYHSAEHMKRLQSVGLNSQEVAIGSWSFREINGDLIIINNKTGKQVVLVRGDDDEEYLS